MNTKPFQFNIESVAISKRVDARALSLTDQQIAVDDEGNNYQVVFPDIFAGYQNPPLTRDIATGNKAWAYQFSLSGVPQPDVASHLRITSPPSCVT